MEDETRGQCSMVQRLVDREKRHKHFGRRMNNKCFNKVNDTHVNLCSNLNITTRNNCLCVCDYILVGGVEYINNRLPHLRLHVLVVCGVNLLPLADLFKIIWNITKRDNTTFSKSP